MSPDTLSPDNLAQWQSQGSGKIPHKHTLMIIPLAEEGEIFIRLRGGIALPLVKHPGYALGVGIATSHMH